MSQPEGLSETPFASLPIFETNAELIEPLTEISEAHLEELRKSFEKAGCNLDLSEGERNTLQKGQFRNLTEGRGTIVVTVLDIDKARRLMTESEKIAESHGNKQKFTTGGRGMGARQVAADLLALTISPEEDRQSILNRINQRVWLGARKKITEDKKAEIDERFIRSSVPPIKKPLEMAYVMPGELGDVLKFLTSK